MGRRFSLQASITAGQQFLGTEFNAQPLKANSKLIVREVLVLKGAENAQLQLSKAVAFGGTTRLLPLKAADTGTTTNGSTTQITEGTSDRVTDLLPGEQVQLVSTGATAAMFAQIQYEEVPNLQTGADVAVGQPGYLGR